MIQYSGLNKKNVLILVCVCITIIGSIIGYTLLKGNQQTQMNEDTIAISKPNNISVTVTNVLNGLNDNIKIEAEGIKEFPPIDNNDVPPIINSNINSTKQSTVVERFQQPQQVKSPKMLVIGNDTVVVNNGNNVISNTNSVVGTGEIGSRLVKQKSLYTIFAGTFIPAVLTTGMNSDLSGEIVGRIRNNVFDSTQGKYLLIPQGSRIVGIYNHEVAFGQNRLMVGWNRVIYPNGTSLSLRGQPGTDLSGYSGFSDSVDNHYSKIFGSAFVMGLIFGGTTVAIGNQNTNPLQLSAGATIANQVGTQMGQAGIQVVQKGINIPPTIMISPGYKFNILLTADLILKPYIFR